MFCRKILSFAVAGALAIGPVSQAGAGSGDALLGGIVGGVIGGVIVNEANKNKRPPRTTTVYRPSNNSATRAANVETQTALNYFGFPAGTPDGVLGGRSRSAVSSMQAMLEFPVTGQLTQFERDILVGAYHRGITGSYDTIQLVSKDPMGSRALLVAQKNLMTGNTGPAPRAGYAGLPIEVSEAVDEIAESSDPSADQLLQRSGFIQLADLNGDGNNDYILDTSFSGSSFWCNAVQCRTLVFVSSPGGYMRNDLLVSDPTPASFSCIGASCTVANAPIMASTAPATPVAPTQPVTTEAGAALQTFDTLSVFAAPALQASLDSHCSKVSLMTNANGGYITAAAMTDPDLVLNEQFCLARAYSMDEGEQLVAGLQGVSQPQVDAQCAPYGPALKDYAASLSLKSRDDVLRDVGGFVQENAMDPAQLALTAKICLSVGYRTDNMDLALGTALLLVVLGEGAYGELVGHHLSQGFGVSKSTDLSLAWYAGAIDAVDQGDRAVFAPNQTDRVELIDAAVTRLSGGEQATVKPVSTKGGSSLPTFNIKK